MQSYAAVLSHSEHLVVVCKHASWLRMQKLGLGRHGGSVVYSPKPQRQEKNSQRQRSATDNLSPRGSGGKFFKNACHSWARSYEDWHPKCELLKQPFFRRCLEINLSKN